MTPWGGRCCETLKVNWGVSPRLDTVQHPDVLDSLKRNPHSNLKSKPKITVTLLMFYKPKSCIYSSVHVWCSRQATCIQYFHGNLTVV